MISITTLEIYTLASKIMWICCDSVLECLGEVAKSSSKYRGWCFMVDPRSDRLAHVCYCTMLGEWLFTSWKSHITLALVNLGINSEKLSLSYFITGRSSRHGQNPTNIRKIVPTRFKQCIHTNPAANFFTHGSCDDWQFMIWYLVREYRLHFRSPSCLVYTSSCQAYVRNHLIPYRCLSLAPRYPRMREADHRRLGKPSYSHELMAREIEFG